MNRFIKIGLPLPLAGFREIAASGYPVQSQTAQLATYARDHSVADGLNYIATWNAAMLMSNDLSEAMQANAGKRAAEFKD